jgi:hypothetical protein
MEKQKFLLVIFFIALLSFVGCEKVNSSEEEAEVFRNGDQIFIKDNTGKSWNVTHAVNEYGFIPQQFQFGLGPFAIRPILNPKMLNPGESGYPGNSESFLVIGATIDGDTRAYPLNVLSGHEVADEEFETAHVAVAY